MNGGSRLYWLVLQVLAIGAGIYAAVWIYGVVAG